MPVVPWLHLGVLVSTSSRNCQPPIRSSIRTTRTHPTTHFLIHFIGKALTHPSHSRFAFDWYRCCPEGTIQVSSGMNVHDDLACCIIFVRAEDWHYFISRYTLHVTQTKHVTLEGRIVSERFWLQHGFS